MYKTAIEKIWDFMFKKAPKKQAGNSSALDEGLEAPLLKVQLDRLLCAVNAVTCPHRHGQEIRTTDLYRLANRQVEVEEALREMGY